MPVLGDATVLETFIETVTDPITDQLTMTNLGVIIAAGLGIAVVFVLGWFAYRWIYRKIKGGFEMGK